MTLDEAIERYTSNAEYERTHGNLQGCLEFKQLADWLKDYKRLLEQEPCEDAISRKKVIDTIYCECSCENLDIDFAKVLLLQRAIKALPSITAQPKMGKWISNAEDDLKISEYTCSNCKGLSDEDSDFCPKCGSYNGGEG